jgi:hypothetical protein
MLTGSDKAHRSTAGRYNRGHQGNAISFGFTGSVQGTTVNVTYTGTADAATMKGKVAVGDMGEGTFSGKKQ